jgi:hypothetical protein
MSPAKTAVILIALIAVGCTGEQGPIGPIAPTGPAGKDGEDGQDGGGVVDSYMWVWWAEDCDEFGDIEACTEEPVPSNRVDQTTDFTQSPTSS